MGKSVSPFFSDVAITLMFLASLIVGARVSQENGMYWFALNYAKLCSNRLSYF